MDRDKFISETNDYISLVYDEFSYYQEIADTILKEFIRICTKYDITYFMAFGSLIGAIRDKGNIPWDYDIDVVVPSSQREKLIKALVNLKDGFFYKYYDNMTNYPASCLRICLEPFPFTALHVDVFFLVACPDDDIKRKKFISEINAVTELRGKKYLIDWFYEYNPKSKLQRLVNFFVKLRAKLIPASKLKREEDLLNKYRFGTTEYCYIVGEPYRKIFKSSWFEKRVYVDTKLGKLSVPNGYHHILTLIYGDYMKYYPIENRFDEMYKMYKIVKKRIEEFQRDK